MDNILWLDNPLHRNSFPKEVLGEEGVLDSLVVTFEGTIMGVDKDAIDSYFNSDESKMIRLGMARPPAKFIIENRDTFYKYLSYQKFSE